MIKKLFLAAICSLATLSLSAQVTIGSGEVPIRAALLDLKDQNPTGENVTSQTGGLVLPRVKLTNRKTLDPFIDSDTDTEWKDAILGKKLKGAHTGLMVYNVSVSDPGEDNEDLIFEPGVYIWNGDQWNRSMGNSSSVNADAWLKNGNLETNPATDFVGTTDNAALVLRTNSKEVMRITTAGNVGIGTATPDSSAIVDMSTNNKGVLIPRIQLKGTTDKTTIANPATGLLVYNIANNEVEGNGDPVRANIYYSWSGSYWDPMMSMKTITEKRIPEPAIFQLSTDQLDFLKGVAAGATSIFPVTEIINSVPNKIELINSGKRLRFQPGVYQITYVYEAELNNQCELSSYFVDFPTQGSRKRIHSTAAHNFGGLSNHGGTITYTFKLTSEYNWDVHLGRGQSGKCWDDNKLRLISGSTHISILRLGD